MTESEIKRICSIINPNLSDDEKLKATVVNKYIINLEKLKSIKNLELIKEVLDEYYYNYYELVYNLLDKNEYKKLYEFLIDYHLYALTKIFLKELGKNNSYQELLNKCYDIFILSNGDLDLAKNQNQLDSSFYVKYKYYRPLHSEVMKYIQEIKNDIYQSIKEEVEQ